MKECPFCAGQLEDVADVCGKCGRKLEEHKALFSVETPPQPPVRRGLVVALWGLGAVIVLGVVVAVVAGPPSQQEPLASTRSIAAPEPALATTPRARSNGMREDALSVGTTDTPLTGGVGLGAPQSAFVARLGRPVRPGEVLADFGKCPGRTAVAGWSVMFLDDRAIAITRNACPPGVHDAATASAEAKALFPPDTVPGKAFVTGDGWKATAYRSASLAKVLPRDRFEDCDGTPVPAGTFFFLLSPERQSWIMGAGLCP
jgi:hypothetical protein